ncbi:hypothetical protein H8356DRAFT_1358471 [Neocallimastix lanati (nom. inval.)]|nr:hypothetical protein H8356DRAFT_1358471 [Neocallimastix sp. JGI-2020a]
MKRASINKNNLNNYINNRYNESFEWAVEILRQNYPYWSAVLTIQHWRSNIRITAKSFLELLAHLVMAYKTERLRLEFSRTSIFTNLFELSGPGPGIDDNMGEWFLFRCSWSMKIYVEMFGNTAPSRNVLTTNPVYQHFNSNTCYGHNERWVLIIEPKRRPVDAVFTNSVPNPNEIRSSSLGT